MLLLQQQKRERVGSLDQESFSQLEFKLAETRAKLARTQQVLAFPLPSSSSSLSSLSSLLSPTSHSLPFACSRTLTLMGRRSRTCSCPRRTWTGSWSWSG